MLYLKIYLYDDDLDDDRDVQLHYRFRTTALELQRILIMVKCNRSNNQETLSRTLSSHSSLSSTCVYHQSVDPTNSTSREARRKGEKYQVGWLDAEHVKCCPLCTQSFHPLRRLKHHCRSCGRVICGACSRHRRMMIQGKMRKRVCDACFTSIPAQECPEEEEEEEEKPSGLSKARCPDNNNQEFTKPSFDERQWKSAGKIQKWFRESLILRQEHQRRIFLQEHEAMIDHLVAKTSRPLDQQSKVVYVKSQASSREFPTEALVTPFYHRNDDKDDDEHYQVPTCCGFGFF